MENLMGKSRKRKDDVTKVDVLRKVAAGIPGLITVAEMDEVRYVPTLFTGYNRATGIGGHPLRRVTLVHGPEQVGKTVFAMVVAESLRVAGHLSFVFEVEWAAEKSWYGLITPQSWLGRPITLDELRDQINKALANLMEGKKARKKAERIPKEVGCVFVVDTLNVLWPKSIKEKVEKEGIEKMYPIRAMWINDWMCEIVPKLYQSNSSLILVSQERENLGARAFERDWKLPGGMSIRYGNCMRVRVTSAKKIKKGELLVVGMECKYTLENNKVDGTSFEKASFFTSNGKGDVPKGLDLVREAIAEGRHRGVLEKKSNSILAKFDGVKFGEWEGGWESLRLCFMEKQHELDAFVRTLNEQARRKS